MNLAYYQSTFFLLLSVLVVAQCCYGLPTYLIISGKPFCLVLDGPQDTIVKIDYTAPDIITDERDPQYGPTYITVNVKPARRIMDTDMHSAPVREHLQPLSKLLDEKQGSLTHQFEVDGTANICIRASTASTRNPMMFGLRVESDEEVPEIDEIRNNMNNKAEPQADVNLHLTHMERELHRITAAMSHVLKEADLNKDQDEIFHEQTLAMHSATTFWPIIQVCVLLITGFSQASHIVRFFKSRRII